MNNQVILSSKLDQNLLLPVRKFLKKVNQFLTGQEEIIHFSEKQLLENEVERLRKELHLRHINFEQAIGEYIDIAIHELNLTQQKYEVAIRQLKKLHKIKKPTT